MTNYTYLYRIASRYYYYFSVLVIMSCQTEKQLTDIQVPEIISVPLATSPGWDYADFFSVEKIITLEPKKLIADVNKLIFHENRIYILDMKSKSIFVFFSNGTFEMEIHNVGKGPEEYEGITDFIIDFKQKEIIVLDGIVGKQIVKYDLNGKFISKQKNSFSCVNLELMQNGYIIYCGNQQSKKNKESSDNFYNVLFSDNNFNIVNYQMPTSSAWSGMRYIFKMNTTFVRYGDAVFCQFPIPNDNIIYQLKSSGLKPLYQFDFGMDRDFLNEDKSISEIISKVRRYNIPHNLSGYFENDRIIYFTVLKGTEVQTVIYDKIVKKAYNRAINVNDQNKYFFPTEYQGDGTFLVQVLMPFMISGHEMENKIPKSIKNTIKSEDNPILVLSKVKMNGY